jgi:hypothetical protein
MEPMIKIADMALVFTAGVTVESMRVNFILIKGRDVGTSQGSNFISRAFHFTMILTNPSFAIPESIVGPIVLCIVENLSLVIDREKVHIPLPMARRTPVSGTKDGITEWDNAFGVMVEYTGENGAMVRLMDLVSKNVRMEQYDTKEPGTQMYPYERCIVHRKNK